MARRRLPAWLSLPVVLASVAVVPLSVLAVLAAPLVVALSLPPLALLLLTFTWFDRIEPEPWTGRVHATLWGATVAVLGAVVVNGAVGLFAGEVVMLVVSAPIIEEVLKAGGVLYIAQRRREVDGIIDGIVYAGWVAAGFAAAENVLYFLESSAAGALTGTFILRGLLTPFAHPLFTLPAGLAIGWAISRRRSPWLWAAWGLVPAISLHAIWNGATVLLDLDGFAIAMVLALAFVALFASTATWLTLTRRHQAHRFTQLIPYLSQRYGLTAQELAAFSTWRQLLATRRSLPDRRTRRHFDRVHAAVARLAALQDRPGGPTAAEDARALAALQEARAGSA